jgi:isopenicillin N synthase-like dioxygenase
MADDPSLPVLNADHLFAGDPAEIAALRAAAERHGFFYLADHGIDPALIAAVFAQSARFFALPDAAKQALHLRRVSHALGWEPIKTQTLEAGGPPDLKEGFYIGPDVSADDPAVLAGRFGLGPNQWPADLPEFRTTMNAYYAAAQALCVKVMDALALALALPADFFAQFTRDPSCRLRLLHYPEQPGQPEPGEKGCGAHTDFGSVTVLLQDSAGGLQVQNVATGAWFDAPPVAGTFVVNLGDLIARWTNHRFQSNPHRVINRSGRERYSVPFFFTGNPDYLVECLPTCLEPGETPKYPAITAEAHLMERYAATYG